jgi:WD40 repeat protein
MAVESDYDPGHIKDVGSQLWRSLSKALGEKVTKNNLHGVLKRLAQNQPNATALSTLNSKSVMISKLQNGLIDPVRYDNPLNLLVQNLSAQLETDLTVTLGSLNSVSLSSDGLYLASGNINGEIQIVDRTTGKCFKFWMQIAAL